jgi:hypothetical protein
MIRLSAVIEAAERPAQVADESSSRKISASQPFALWNFKTRISIIPRLRAGLPK